ncbi:hypothetical protein Sango_1743700 [Sesamum angolense]|uniref:Reverse transcriptase zinc-binding domain-containing protein n=1 Tax=Sesamum angolense TaxID=2727404 RepID=A0AAE1WMG7_9LAMI|nr:hypothetical protein Sango_1743700 [Sesamum angolense]
MTGIPDFDSTRLVLGLEKSWQSRVDEDYILDMPSGGCVVRHGHYKLYLVQLELHANLHESHLILSKSTHDVRDSLLLILGFQEGHLPVRYLGLPLLASLLTTTNCEPLLMKIDGRIKGWEGIQLSFAGKTQVIKSVLMALNLYWAMAFILPKKIIQEVEKYLHTFLWKGSSERGYPKMDVIKGEHSSIWVDWIYHIRLREHSVWSMSDRHWPLLTDLESLEILHSLPTIDGGSDRIEWQLDGGVFITGATSALFAISGPKVAWSLLLLGSFKIPRNNFILWLAILGKLSTLDKPWLNHLGGACILFTNGLQETHYHLLFNCSYSRRCLEVIRQRVQFYWPNRQWTFDIEWASAKWRGQHVVNAAYRALLVSLVYHV